MGRILFTVILILFSTSSFAEPLTGIGYGKNQDEAKKEALADLASIIKVQVYSKYEQTVKSGGDTYGSQSSRFIRLISNVPLINPTIIYSKEDGKIKALAVIDNSDAYIKKASDLSKTINSIADFSSNIDKATKYRRLENIIPIYNQYESCITVLSALGVDSYETPIISYGEVVSMLLDMQETPPSLEIAAEILAKPTKSIKNITVELPLTMESNEETPFSHTLKELLSSKMETVKNKNSADYTFSCLYSPLKDNIIISCNLISGGNTIVGSSVTKVPTVLLEGLSFKPKSKDLKSIIDRYQNEKTTLHTNIKISSDGMGNIIKAGDTFTLLVKSNKVAYLYIASYRQGSDTNFGKVLPLDKNNNFIKKIREKDVNRWVSVGVFKADNFVGTETLQLFALMEKPAPKDILPDYIFNNSQFQSAEILAEDLLYLFSKQSGDKNVNTLTYTIVGGGR